jgi:hypothetical protein
MFGVSAGQANFSELIGGSAAGSHSHSLLILIQFVDFYSIAGRIIARNVQRGTIPGFGAIGHQAINLMPGFMSLPGLLINWTLSANFGIKRSSRVRVPDSIQNLEIESWLESVR